MSEPFLGDIKIVAFNFAPRGWATCDGQILPISQNQSLYALLGSTFGGDGRTDFALPDLRGRAPVGVGNASGLSNRSWGEWGGTETVALSNAEMPPHTHQMRASSDPATAATPAGNLPGTVFPAFNVYGSNANADGNSNQVANTGEGQGHTNMQPYTTLTFIIALQGQFPSRN